MTYRDFRDDDVRGCATELSRIVCHDLAAPLYRDDSGVAACVDI